MTDPTPTTPRAGVYRCAECDAIWRTEAQRDLCCTARQESTTPREIAGLTETVAAMVECPRHVPKMRACLYVEGKPCVCRQYADGLAVRAEIEREAGR